MASVPYMQIRKGLGQMEVEGSKALGPPPDTVEEFYHTTKLADGYEGRLKIWRSKKVPPAGRPVIVLWHGGSYMSGSVEMETRPGREFDDEFGALVIAGTYRLAPEHKFPISFNDGWQLTV